MNGIKSTGKGKSGKSYGAKEFTKKSEPKKLIDKIRKIQFIY